MKIWAISDTHGFHDYLQVPEVDMVIHAGDSTNYKELFKNELEFENFLRWYSKLDIKHKILIAGNHDASLTKKYNVDKVRDYGIIYLEHEDCEVEGITIFGSPYTPTFGDWYFMKDRSKLDRYWQMLKSCDILVTHGPPKGILDLSFDRNRNLEYCGDSALLKRVLDVKPKYHIFGHIHDCEGVINKGIRIYQDITFVNASCVTDGRFDKGVTSNGIILNY